MTKKRALPLLRKCLATNLAAIMVAQTAIWTPTPTLVQEGSACGPNVAMADCPLTQAQMISRFERDRVSPGDYILEAQAQAWLLSHFPDAQAVQALAERNPAL